jgi:hypothetical protein
MSQKMNYGKRWSSGGFENKVEFNEIDDRRHRKQTAHMLAIMNARPLHKKELAYYKTGVAAKKAHAKKSPGPEREEAEQRMAEAVRQCVALLEFHMEDMDQYRKVANRPSYCFQQAIHNVIYDLRRKSGVQFDEINPRYVERQCETQRRRDAHEKAADDRDEREQQRLSRLRNMKEMAERMAEKHNAGLK